MYYLFFVFRIWVSGGDGGVFFDGVGEFMGWIGDGLVVWVRWFFVCLVWGLALWGSQAWCCGVERGCLGKCGRAARVQCLR